MTVDLSALARGALDRIQADSEAILEPPDIVEWAEKNFYVIETKKPIVLEPHQKEILRVITEIKNGRFVWKTVLYSTIKKSGKTTISALVSRWAAETWGYREEVYNLGNKLGQAKDRAFRKVRDSIELAPAAIKDNWEIKEIKMTHIPSGSIIQALPISDAGEAGGNQSLSVWTELWGFEYEAALRMWDELQPVPTRRLSLRFVDTYAGYRGESTLLESVWAQVLDVSTGELAPGARRLHPTLPLYGNPDTGLVAYIDQGEAARRMPWQLGADGKQYYAQQEKAERKHNFLRLHHNLWVSSVNALVPVEIWDALKQDNMSIPANAPVWLAADASIRRDCTALMGIALLGDVVQLFHTQIWEPDGIDIDYNETLVPAVEWAIENYNVMGVAYDEWQLHSVMTELEKKYKKPPHKIPFHAFDQGATRLRADTNFVWRITEGKLRHNGDDTLRAHLINSAAKDQRTGKALRIEKRSTAQRTTEGESVTARPIDGIIAASMACWYATEIWEPIKTPTMKTTRFKW